MRTLPSYVQQPAGGIEGRYVYTDRPSKPHIHVYMHTLCSAQCDDNLIFHVTNDTFAASYAVD